ncbi:ankyrin repeat domain-containing protein 17-like isoform X1 [Penaeus indicus]|uniref:ankyrin repeat domain-containing protein 17-like isoform X1 n=1 Tax=Penaeus indicus TaxID=29960 RepID=UPI00300C11BB
MAYKQGGQDDQLLKPCICPAVVFASLPGDMYLAAKNGDLRRVRKYLEDGHDINAADSDGYTLLSSACVGGQLSVVRLLQRQPHLHRNPRDWAGDTPLMYAAMMGHAEVVKELISRPHQCRLDVNACNNYDETALDLAIINNHADVESTLQNVKLPQLSAGGNNGNERLIVKPSVYVELKFECEVCLEDYDKNERRPRILSCGHSLCTSCITETLNHGPLKCPFCRSPHVVNVRFAAEVPVNFTVDGVIQQQGT